MLVLSRKVGQKFVVGDDVRITVVKVEGNTVRIGIEAPSSLSIMRQELLEVEIEAPRVAAA